MVENPFYYNQPVEPSDFVGRWSLVNDILNDLIRVRADSWAIIGGRRFGKSSVLKILEHGLQSRLQKLLPQERSVFPVLVDLKGSEIENEQKVYARILQLLYRALLRHPPAASALREHNPGRELSVSYYEFEEKLDFLQTELKKELGAVRLILLLDEVESIIKYPWSETLLNQLRSMIYDGPLSNIVKIVLTGSAQVVQVRHEGSPLLNALKVVHLESLDAAGIGALMQRAGWISAGVEKAIRALAGGHPFIAQYVLHHLWKDGLTEVSEFQEEQVGNQMRQTRLSDFEGWWRAIGNSGQEAYGVMARYSGWVHERELLAQLDPINQPDQGLSALCYHGIAHYDRSTSSYETTAKVFLDWYRVNVAGFQIQEIPDSQPTVLSDTADDPQDESHTPFIFISYSHKDRVWKDRLQSHLKVLELHGNLSVWEDKQISLGEDWFAKIHDAMHSANIAILLISADFLTSNFILGHEVPHLLKKRATEGLKIIPVIIRPCAWQSVPWLASIQCFPSEGRALSGGTDHQIDNDLAELVSQVAASW